MEVQANLNLLKKKNYRLEVWRNSGTHGNNTFLFLKHKGPKTGTYGSEEWPPGPTERDGSGRGEGRAREMTGQRVQERGQMQRENGRR